MAGTLYVECPCCGTRLEADRETGKVVAQWGKKEKKSGDPIKAAMEKLKADQRRRETFFDTVKDDLDARKRQADERFEAERRRIAEEGDASRPPHPFDND